MASPMALNGGGDLPAPSAFGLPPQFRDWRPGQAEAVLEVIRPWQRRFLVHAQPTGFGKSAVYMAAASQATGRTVILTATKALQDQLLREFVGVVNYQSR